VYDPRESTVSLVCQSPLSHERLRAELDRVAKMKRRGAAGVAVYSYVSREISAELAVEVPEVVSAGRRARFTLRLWAKGSGKGDSGRLDLTEALRGFRLWDSFLDLEGTDSGRHIYFQWPGTYDSLRAHLQSTKPLWVLKDRSEHLVMAYQPAGWRLVLFSEPGGRTSPPGFAWQEPPTPYVDLQLLSAGDDGLQKPLQKRIVSSLMAPP
jgi:hypothetical protein